MKKRYLNSIKALSEALNKVNDCGESHEYQETETARKLERVRQKKRDLKRIISDHHDPHIKQVGTIHKYHT